MIHYSSSGSGMARRNSWASGLCAPSDKWGAPFCSLGAVTTCCCPVRGVFEALEEMKFASHVIDSPLQTCCDAEAMVSICFTSAFWLPCCYMSRELAADYRYDEQVQPENQALCLLAAYCPCLCCMGPLIYGLRRVANRRLHVGENFCQSAILVTFCWPCTLNQTLDALFIARTSSSSSSSR
jgi:hypothetical protein